MQISNILGILLIIFGVVVCIFRRSFSGWLSMSRNIGGRSLKEKFGERKAEIITFIFGLVMIILGVVAMTR